MEPVGAKWIWKRSAVKKIQRYTKFNGDRNIKSFINIQDTYPGIKVKNYVGHVLESWMLIENVKQTRKGAWSER